MNHILLLNTQFYEDLIQKCHQPFFAPCGAIADAQTSLRIAMASQGTNTQLLVVSLLDINVICYKHSKYLKTCEVATVIPALSCTIGRDFCKTKQFRK